MATQPPTSPDHIDPQFPPEAPPMPGDPIEPYPGESEPLSPDIDEPGRSPDEFPAIN